MRKSLFLMCGFCVVLGGIIAGPATAQYISVPGVSSHAQGAGVAVGYLDANSKPDMILMAYHHAKEGNTFRYKVGKDLAPDGTAASWGQVIEVAGVGKEAMGAGAAMKDINANKKPDLVFMAYEKGVFRYRVGWDLDAAGIASSWSDIVESGCRRSGRRRRSCIGDIDGNGRPELVLMAYDSSEGLNSFRYRIGWNINPGAVTDNWDRRNRAGRQRSGRGGGDRCRGS